MGDSQLSSTPKPFPSLPTYRPLPPLRTASSWLSEPHVWHNFIQQIQHFLWHFIRAKSDLAPGILFACVSHKQKYLFTVTCESPTSPWRDHSEEQRKPYTPRTLCQLRCLQRACNHRSGRKFTQQPALWAISIWQNESLMHSCFSWSGLTISSTPTGIRA